MPCVSTVYHTAQPYIIDFFRVFWYNSVSNTSRGMKKCPIINCSNFLLNSPSLS